jgi:hypothetical protein
MSGLKKMLLLISSIATHGSPLSPSPEPALAPELGRDISRRLGMRTWHLRSPSSSQHPTLPTNITYIFNGPIFWLHHRRNSTRLSALTHRAAAKLLGSGRERRPDGSGQPEAAQS